MKTCHTQLENTKKTHPTPQDPTQCKDPEAKTRIKPTVENKEEERPINNILKRLSYNKEET